MHISKIAALEESNGVGISTTVRLYFRKNISWMKAIRNSELNEIIAKDFQKAKPVYRFKLKTGELAEIRKSSNIYYVAKIISGNQYAIISVQSSWKAPAQPITTSRRMKENWQGDKK